jgi:hypothetical protein
LELAVPVWSPHRKGLIDMLEKVQARATKIPFSLRHLSYEQRVQAFRIEKLESRRTRGDLIQVFKAQNGLEDINWHHGLKYGNSTVTTRGNSRKMRRQVFTARLRNDFLTNRVVPDWNKLPEEAVGARSLNIFKARYDEWV